MAVLSKKRKIKKTWDDHLFYFITNFSLLMALILVLYPLVYIVSASFSSPQAVTSGQVWLYPVDVSLEGYRVVFNTPLIWTGYKNSLVVAAMGSVLAVSMQFIYAYVLSVRDLVGKKILNILIIIPMFIGGGLIPSYLLIQNLGIYNTFWALVLPASMSTFSIFVTRSFIQSDVPYDIYESAAIDGCSDIRYLVSILIPLSKPILAVLFLWSAVGHWNNYFSAMIYISSQSKYTLQLVLRDILIQNQLDPSMMVDASLLQQRQGLSELLKFSLIVVSSLPMLILYPFIQKYFVKGVMIGSVKG